MFRENISGYGEALRGTRTDLRYPLRCVAHHTTAILGAQYVIAQRFDRLEQQGGFASEGSLYFEGVETWTLGDSPLVLLTALNDWVPSASKGPRGPFECRRTGSSRFEEIVASHLDSNRTALPQASGRKIRLYSSIDTRLMFGDFLAKPQMNFPQ